MYCRKCKRNVYVNIVKKQFKSKVEVDKPYHYTAYCIYCNSYVKHVKESVYNKWKESLLS